MLTTKQVERFLGLCISQPKAKVAVWWSSGLRSSGVMELEGENLLLNKALCNLSQINFIEKLELPEVRA